MHEFRTILYEVERGRARITLNRPEKLNALSLELQEELNRALWDADNDTAVHAVIIKTTPLSTPSSSKGTGAPSARATTSPPPPAPKRTPPQRTATTPPSIANCATKTGA